MKKCLVLLVSLVYYLISVSNVNAQTLKSVIQTENNALANLPQLRVSLPNLQSLPTVVVNMNTTYNGIALPSFSIAVSAAPYAYGTVTNLKYRFTITNVSTNTTAPDVIQTSRFVNIPTAIQMYNAVYTIKASAVIDDVVYDYAGNTITVLSPTIPLITLASVTCGTTLANLTSTLVANPGIAATSYTFRIRLAGDTSGTYGYSPSTSRFVGANTFAGFPLLYGTTYNVAVQYTFTDPYTGLPVNSGYGGECMIETPKFTLISLVSPTCGSQVGTLTSAIVAAPGPYATVYQFRIRKTTNDNEAPVYYYSAPSTSRFSSLAAFGITLAYNTSYSISVRYGISGIVRGVWAGYGYECIIITPPAPTLKAAEVSFKATAYPNPFANNFRIDVKTTSNSLVNLKVYDMLGRLIEQSNSSVSDIMTTTIGDQYPGGIYNIVLSQEDSVETRRVIKQ